jgi:hypothetical protein
MMTYPARRHGIGGKEARVHLFTMMTEFLKTSLDVRTPDGAATR